MAKIFDVTKEGKGVSKEQVRKKKGLILFLDIYFRRFWKFINLNLVYLLTSIPAIYIAHKLSRYILIVSMNLANIPPTDEAAIASGITLAWFLVLVLIHFCGAGPTTAGLNYVLKKYTNDSHAWVWGDFVRGIKDNWKQALAAYFINTVITFACFVSMICYSYAEGSYRYLVPVVMAALIFFVMMQMYVYQLMVGFKLTLKQIYKNAALLTVLKFPRNVSAIFLSMLMMWLLSNLALSTFNAMFYFLFAIIMLVFFSLFTFIQLFVTRNVVQWYMIDLPKQKNKNKKRECVPVFEEKDFSDECEAEISVEQSADTDDEDDEFE